MPTRGAVHSVPGASNGHRQKESNAALRLVRCTIDRAETEEVTRHLLDLTLMVAFHDAFRRDLAHLADRPDDLDLLQAMQDEHARIDPLLAAVEGASRIWQPRYAHHDHWEPSTQP